MTSDPTWERIQQVFEEALELEGAAREARVQAACGRDAELLQRVTILLQAHDALELEPQSTFGLGEGLDIEMAGVLLQDAPAEPAEGSSIGRYRIVRRVASGGMGVVYLAHDDRLDRPVALKLLPLWRTADPDANQRLEDEARAASALDHPHLATVYEIGESHEGRRFIAMAWYEGGTLRERLSHGRMPIAAAVGIAGQIAEGLSAAHRRGIVHRDIKPENIAFGRGDRAVIVDFGIASAVRLAPGPGGRAAGTVAYMSPEQIRGEPVDDRTDIWSLGVVLYEMLTGHRPFRAQQDEALARTIENDSPVPIPTVGENVPDDLAELVARCLEKRAADRFASAEDLAQALRGIARSSTDVAATGPVKVEFAGRLPDGHPAGHHLGGSSLWQVSGAYLLGGWLMYHVTVGLTHGLGLPGWVPTTSLVLLAVGLPVVILTTIVQQGLPAGLRRREASSQKNLATSGERQRVVMRDVLTWRRSIIAGVLAFAFLAAGAASYSGMRTLGIGPIGTLEARGLIDQREPIVLADFVTDLGDQRLGRVVTEALRIDLLQSRTLRLAQPAEVVDGLRRMNRDPAAGVPEDVARELALRDGLKALIAGEVSSLGGGFVLTARVIAATDGATLTAVRETARDSTGLIDAVDRLSKRLRERIGEPLRALHASEPLPRVATASLPALRKYAEGARLSAYGGSDVEIAALMEEAVAIDSSFATAYRALAVSYWNLRVDQGRIVHATRRAYELRGRLPDRERLLVEATYYTNIRADMERAGRVFAHVLELDPTDTAARNNYALSHLFGGRPVEAEAILRAAPPDAPAMLRLNLADALLFQDRVDEALDVLDAGVAAFGESPLWAVTRIRILGADWRWDEAEAAAHAALIDHADNVAVRMHALRSLWHLALARGRLDQAEQYFAELIPVIEVADATEVHARVRLQRAEAWLMLLGDKRRARDEVLDIMNEMDLLTAGAVIAPRAAATLAGAGATREAADLLRDWEAQPPEMRAHISYYSEDKGWARIALAEGDLATAIARLEGAAADSVNYINVVPDLVWAYREAGRHDGAIAAAERYLFKKHSRWVHRVPPYLGPVLLQLGELYEETGRHEEAVGAYAHVIELWHDADSELQPRVDLARGRIEALQLARHP